MNRRQRIGNRRHSLDAKQHDGTTDSLGTPTYHVAGDWDTVTSGWPVEMLVVSGGETLRGRQVTAQTTHVFYGEYYGGKDIEADMKVVVENVEYDVVTAYDPWGDRQEFRVEAKRER